MCDIIGDQIEYVLFKVTWLSINTINTSGDQLVSSSGFVWLKAWEVLVQDRQQFAFRSLGLSAAHNREYGMEPGDGGAHTPLIPTPGLHRETGPAKLKIKV